jgi:hypothetical protein
VENSYAKYAEIRAALHARLLLHATVFGQTGLADSLSYSMGGMPVASPRAFMCPYAAAIFAPMCCSEHGIGEAADRRPVEAPVREDDIDC